MSERFLNIRKRIKEIGEYLRGIKNTINSLNLFREYLNEISSVSERFANKLDRPDNNWEDVLNEFSNEIKIEINTIKRNSKFIGNRISTKYDANVINSFFTIYPYDKFYQSINFIELSAAWVETANGLDEIWTNGYADSNEFKTDLESDLPNRIIECNKYIKTFETTINEFKNGIKKELAKHILNANYVAKECSIEIINFFENKTNGTKFNFHKTYEEIIPEADFRQQVLEVLYQMETMQKQFLISKNQGTIWKHKTSEGKTITHWTGIIGTIIVGFLAIFGVCFWGTSENLEVSLNLEYLSIYFVLYGISIFGMTVNLIVEGLQKGENPEKRRFDDINSFFKWIDIRYKSFIGSMLLVLVVFFIIIIYLSVIISQSEPKWDMAVMAFFVGYSADTIAEKIWKRFIEESSGLFKDFESKLGKIFPEKIK